MTDAEVIARLAPHAHFVYRTAFAKSGQTHATNMRRAHFLAQCCHETGGLTILQESLNYSTPERLMAVWPSRFKTPGFARDYVHNPRKLANYVYSGRMGNTEPEDGWRYIGRGLPQITGREMYRAVGVVLGVNLEEKPELAVHEDYVLPIALAVWEMKGCDEPADRDDVAGVTKRINGGTVGLKDRKDWLARAKSVLGVKDAA